MAVWVLSGFRNRASLHRCPQLALIWETGSVIKRPQLCPEVYALIPRLACLASGSPALASDIFLLLC